MLPSGKAENRTVAFCRGLSLFSFQQPPLFYNFMNSCSRHDLPARFEATRALSSVEATAARFARPNITPLGETARNLGSPQHRVNLPLEAGESRPPYETGTLLEC